MSFNKVAIGIAIAGLFAAVGIVSRGGAQWLGVAEGVFAIVEVLALTCFLVGQAASNKVARVGLRAVFALIGFFLGTYGGAFAFIALLNSGLGALVGMWLAFPGAFAGWKFGAWLSNVIRRPSDAFVEFDDREE